MIRIDSVEAALSWAYQQGYVYAGQAATEYCAATGAAVAIEDLGQYPDCLHFFSSPSEYERTRDARPNWAKYRPLTPD